MPLPMVLHQRGLVNDADDRQRTEAVPEPTPGPTTPQPVALELGDALSPPTSYERLSVLVGDAREAVVLLRAPDEPVLLVPTDVAPLRVV